MYYKNKAKIEVTRKDGKKITFYSYNAVEIVRDIFVINSSAKVAIPLSARLKKANNTTESVQTANVFNRGDAIKIWLGYDDDLRLEFEGFVQRINFTKPLQIECEGYEHLLKEPIETRTFINATLKEVIEYIIKDTAIQLTDDTPDMEFDTFIIGANLNKLQALQLVKEKYGLTIFFKGAQLYAGLAYTHVDGEVKYELGTNTLKDDQLKYRDADDVSLKIKAVLIRPDNTKLEVEVGDPSGSLRTLHFYNVSSQADLTKLANEEMKKYKYSGYEGRITTFIQPFAQPGMKGVIRDINYPERDGTYYITKTTVKADTGGARRTVEFTIKL